MAKKKQKKVKPRNWLVPLMWLHRKGGKHYDKKRDRKQDINKTIMSELIED
jgi:hypothetical protein